MSTPDPISGKDATITLDAAAVDEECLGWRVEPKGGESRYASDKTGGHRVAWPTINDYDCYIKFKVPATGQVPMNRGNTPAVVLDLDGGDVNKLSGNMVVLEEPITVDIGSDDTIEIEYHLGPRGPLTYYGIFWAGAGSSGIPNS